MSHFLKRGVAQETEKILQAILCSSTKNFVAKSKAFAKTKNIKVSGYKYKKIMIFSMEAWLRKLKFLVLSYTVRNNFRCGIGKARSGKIPIPHRFFSDTTSVFSDTTSVFSDTTSEIISNRVGQYHPKPSKIYQRKNFSFLSHASMEKIIIFLYL